MTATLTSAACRDLEELVRRLSKETPGTGYAGLAVARGHGTELSAAFLRGERVAMAPRSSLASVTKPITATAVMQLVESGAIELDAPVAAYVPEFEPEPPRGRRHAAEVTVRHVLSHTSGLADLPDRELSRVFGSPAAMLDGVLHQRLRFAPGTAYAYASDPWYLLSTIVERISGMAYPQFLRDRVLVPAGMASTTFDPREPGRASLPPEGMFPVNGLSVEQLAMSFATLQMPAGGLWSTPDDVARFGRAMLLGGSIDGARIVDPSSVAAMTSVETAGLREFSTGAPEYYGLGWLRFGMYPGSPASAEAFGHSSATGSALFVDPARDLVVAYLGNWWDAPMDAAHRAITAVYAALDRR